MPRESVAARKARTGKIIALLKQRYPDAHCALNFTNPLELLVATILSAQCTDKRVNIVTRDLFAKYCTAEDYAGMDAAVFGGEIQSTGFFRNKTRSIQAAARRIVDVYGGRVPDTMDDLLTLSGVARKTANVVLGNAFGKNEGVVVDTHVLRVAGRLGLSAHTQPVKMEQDLMQLVPREEWAMFSHLLIFHGRQTCAARKPDCAGCPVNKLCPSAFKARAPGLSSRGGA